jgi:uncharacterized protein YybS (DUF2232 family)
MGASLFLAASVVPVVGSIATLLTPLPALRYAVGRRWWHLRTLSAVALTAVIVGALAGPVAGVGYLATVGLATVIMSLMLEREKPFELIVLTAGIALFLSLGAAGLAATGSFAALSEAVRNTLLQGLERSREFYRFLGAESALGQHMEANILDVATELAPALILISCCFAVFFNLTLLWRFSQQTQLSYALFKDLARWSAPEWMVWVLIAAGFSLFIPFEPIRVLALDVFMCVLAVYFCQGVAIMAFYFHALGMPALARGIIYLVTGLQPILAALVCAAGLFDLWIDFRRLKPPSPEAGSFSGFL